MEIQSSFKSMFTIEDNKSPFDWLDVNRFSIVLDDITNSLEFWDETYCIIPERMLVL